MAMRANWIGAAVAIVVGCWAFAWGVHSKRVLGPVKAASAPVVGQFEKRFPR